jgi:hypothetical protein
MQGKGLLATEGFVTVPLFDAEGAVPTYRSHVLEFVDDEGEARGIHELAPGDEYRVVLTTGGGLYRYALGDRVRVTGSYRGLPRLEFVGRPTVSDLVGEKLDADHARRAVEDALAYAGFVPRFAMLAPEASADEAGYVLFLEGDLEALDAHRLGNLVDRLERRLGDNVQYAHARGLGQLDRLRVFRVRAGADAAYLRRSVAEGQALGDVKPTGLDRRTGWTAWFEGDMLDGRSPALEATSS